MFMFRDYIHAEFWNITIETNKTNRFICYKGSLRAKVNYYENKLSDSGSSRKKSLHIISALRSRQYQLFLTHDAS